MNRVSATTNGTGSKSDFYVIVGFPRWHAGMDLQKFNNSLSPPGMPNGMIDKAGRSGDVKAALLAS